LLYRLTDEYSLFYLQFIENNAHEGSGIWQMLSQTQPYKTWSGYTFENICLKHLPQIKKALGISGILSQASSYVKKGSSTEEGIQIDLVLDRNDGIINLFEMKFYQEMYAMSQQDLTQLREKARLFRAYTDTNKHLSWVFVTTQGLKENSHSQDIVDKALTLDDLFE
jgi:hypothetical protein